MEAKLPHAIYARTDVVMLLTMLTGVPSRSDIWGADYLSSAFRPKGTTRRLLVTWKIPGT